MQLAAHAPLLFVWLVGVNAERPSEGGKILELDASGHMLAHGINATGGHESVFLQTEAATRDSAGSETELRAVLHQAGANEASTRMLIHHAPARNVAINGPASCPAEGQIPGCESMCYRLYLTEIRWGFCPEMQAEAAACCHWKPPQVKYWERNEKEMKKIKKDPWSLPYDTLTVNTMNSKVPDYIQGLRTYFDSVMSPKKREKFFNVIQKIKLGMEVRETVDVGAEALAGRIAGDPVLKKMTSLIDTAEKSAFKYDSMREGIAEMRVIAKILHHKVGLEKCIADADQAKKKNDETLDVAFVNLRNEYDAAKQHLKVQDPKQRQLLQRSEQLLTGIKASLKRDFKRGTDKATAKLGDEKEAEDAFRTLAELNGRMDKLAPSFNSLLRDMEAKEAEAKECMRKRYFQAVEKAEDGLTIALPAAKCDEMCKDLKPKIEFMKVMGFWKELLARAETIGVQLHAWSLLNTAIENGKEVIQTLENEAEARKRKEADRKKMEEEQKQQEEEEQEQQARKAPRYDPEFKESFNLEDLKAKYENDFPGKYEDEEIEDYFFHDLKPAPEGKGKGRGRGKSKAEVTAEPEEEKSEVAPKKAVRLSQSLGKALAAAASLPVDFEDEIDKVKGWCENLLQPYGGCHNIGQVPHGAGPSPQNAAWYSALPSFTVHLFALLVAKLWPSL